MLLPLIASHFVAAALAPVLVRRLDRDAFLVLAVVPLVSCGWLVTQTGRVTGASAEPVVSALPWIDQIGIELAFAVDTLRWTLGLLVTGIGALVLVYCARYFRPGDAGLSRFSAVLTGFAGSMLGLVVSDDLLLLFVFWELTTVFSYLLVGHNPERQANRRAAMTALVVTTFGGLAMLVGFVVLGELVGSYRVGDVLAESPEGALATVALGLVLVGAVSKSALVPFHFWLPGAMAAPTPVSAYLHAAAMVKAGVFLVALLGPAFADDPVWRPTLLVLGVATMLLGGLRALVQHDLKLLLAYGTVSQLGFLAAVLGLGTRAAALAGLAMLCAHALFKAALFMVVGVVDHSCGTRDLRQLSGLRERMPAVVGVAVLAAASMAGLPPLFGFVAKESVYAAFQQVAEHGEGTGIPAWAAWAALAGLALGSCLTVAYSLRFAWALAVDQSGARPPREASPVAGLLLAPAGLLAAAGLAAGFLGAQATGLFAGYDHLYPAGHEEEYLALWHGPGLPLWLTLGTLVAGTAIHRGRRRWAPVARWGARVPQAEHAYHRGMRTLDRFSVELTGLTQRGSLPLYLGTVLLVLVLLPGTVLVTGTSFPDDVVRWQQPAQPVVAALMTAAAVAAVRSRKRIKAVMLASVVGYGVAMLFVLHGAPDLALTQVLVETVTLVVFLLVLRRFPPYFSDRPLTASRWWRVGLGVLAGATVAGAALVAAGARSLPPVSVDYAREAYEFGGGQNVVNVTLVDIRAWDTMGELSVLVVAATGVASLVFLITGRAGRVEPDLAIEAPSRWLRAGRTLVPQRRSALFEMVTRLSFHTIVVVSLFLVFSGHNQPGGGFAGGLVVGLALMVRYLAGGRHELDDAAPVDAGSLLGLGLFVATSSALAPLLFGGEVLQSAIVRVDVPLLGEVKLVTSLFFDLGVYVVVIGLMLDILRSLGGGVDAQAEDEDTGEAGTAPVEGPVEGVR